MIELCCFVEKKKNILVKNLPLVNYDFGIHHAGCSIMILEYITLVLNYDFGIHHVGHKHCDVCICNKSKIHFFAVLTHIRGIYPERDCGLFTDS
jgi:hypothetical protein